MPARTKRGFTLIELLVVIAIIAILAAILFPVFARARKAAMASGCQSNMKQIGKAIKLYLSDWQDTFPTNRPYSGGNRLVLANVAAHVPLTPAGLMTAAGDPVRFQYGITWVEALYSYVEQVTKQEDASSAWKCPAASNAAYPTDPNYFPNTSYVFNANLIEQPEGIAKSASNLMMVREFGRLTCSTLRPVNVSISNSGVVPQYPFLNRTDFGPTDTSRVCRVHGDGSHILFADGHVKHYGLAFYPEMSAYTAGRAWDTTTQQWYNYNNVTVNQRTLRLTIAVTP